MDSDRIKEKIRENAAEIGRLHSRIHETVRHRHEGPKERLAWERVCAEFHKRYSTLAFPGGYQGALERIKSGDPNAMEVQSASWNADRTFFGLAICSRTF
jgi:hypothetical protein